MKKLSLYALLGLGLLAGCGIENALVGGQCRAGKVLENDLCVDPTGNSPPETPFTTPLSPPDGGETDAASPALVDSGAADAPNSNVTDKDPELTLADSGADSGIDMMCVPPLVACRGMCISVDHDPMNCGACGKQCPSNICVAGECQGATPGDVVVIGHDYTNATTGSAQTKVLVNAMSIPTTDPIRVLSFENGASASAVAQMKARAPASVARSSSRWRRRRAR